MYFVIISTYPVDDMNIIFSDFVFDVFISGIAGGKSDGKKKICIN